MSAEARREHHRGEGAGEGLGPERLVSENLGLVYDAAKQLDRSGGTGPERGDLISAGVQGLIQAAHSYDPERGLAFSTLAVTRIRGAMLDELRRWDRVPRSLRRRERELRVGEETLRRKLGRDPDVSEVAEEVGVSTDEVHAWRADLYRLDQESLDRTPELRDTTGYSIAESTPDARLPVDDEISREQVVEILGECIASLPVRDARVLALYYYEGLRLREIAQVLGVTESRISQIRHGALKALRILLHEHGVDP